MSPLLSKQALLRYGPAVAMTALVLTLSLLPAGLFHPDRAPLPPIPGADKFVHALMYAALTAAYLHTASLARRTRLSTVLWVALAAALYGLALEFCQRWLTTTRAMDPLDALANTTGALACALIIRARARRACGTSVNRDNNNEPSVSP